MNRKRDTIFRCLLECTVCQNHSLAGWGVFHFFAINVMSPVVEGSLSAAPLAAEKALAVQQTEQAKQGFSIAKHTNS